MVTRKFPRSLLAILGFTMAMPGAALADEAKAGLSWQP